MTTAVPSRTLPSNDAVISQIVTPILLSFILHFNGEGGKKKLPLFHILEQGPHHLKSPEVSADFH